MENKMSHSIIVSLIKVPGTISKSPVRKKKIFKIKMREQKFFLSTSVSSYADFRLILINAMCDITPEIAVLSRETEKTWRESLSVVLISERELVWTLRQCSHHQSALFIL
jgi:hypothetical protein